MQRGDIAEIENSGIEKLKRGQLIEAAELFREAIKLGSTNFRSRFLLTRILMEVERGNFPAEMFVTEYSAEANLEEKEEMKANVQ